MKVRLCNSILQEKRGEVKFVFLVFVPKFTHVLTRLHPLLRFRPVRRISLGRER